MSVFSYDINKAPLDRAWFDRFIPAARITCGFIFLIWSWASTVLIGGDFMLAPLIGNGSSMIPFIADKYLLTLLFAFGVTLLEIFTERWARIHWPIVLFLDADFTAIQTYFWLSMIVGTYTPLTSPVLAIIGVASIACGVVAAKSGEFLIFGNKRNLLTKGA